MADQQAGSTPSEHESYDGDLRADVAAAFAETNKASDTVVEDKAPEVKADPVKTDDSEKPVKTEDGETT